jgi:hypothetical protein
VVAVRVYAVLLAAAQGGRAFGRKPANYPRTNFLPLKRAKFLGQRSDTNDPRTRGSAVGDPVFAGRHASRAKRTYLPAADRGISPEHLRRCFLHRGGP